MKDNFKINPAMKKALDKKMKEEVSKKQYTSAVPQPESNINVDGMLEHFQQLRDKFKPEEFVNRIEVQHIHELVRLFDDIGVETIHNNYNVASYTRVPIIKNETLPPNYFKIYNNRGDVIGEGNIRKPTGYEPRVRDEMKVAVPNHPFKVDPV